MFRWHACYKVSVGDAWAVVVCSWLTRDHLSVGEEGGGVMGEVTNIVL